LATPEGQKENRLSVFGEVLPEMAPGERLIDIAHLLGWASPERAPLTWLEIDAYNRTMGSDLQPYEARCLVDMSRAYITGFLDDNPLSKQPMERNL